MVESGVKRRRYYGHLWVLGGAGMNQYDLINTLGKAFAEGEIDALVPLMAADCDYGSQYAKKTFKGVQDVIANMKTVYSKLKATSAYAYEIIELKSVLSGGLTLQKLDNMYGMHPCRYGLLLYQYGAEKPVAVVACMIDLHEKFRSILLSRDKSKFNVCFYGEEIEADLPDDLPSTVLPLTTHDRHAGEMQNSFAGQRRKSAVDVTNGIYIWKKADEYVKKWLPDKGYTVLKSAIFEDCIGYRCNRKDYDYTVFMYAYGIEKSIELDGEFCSKLAKLPFAANSTILILYLNVNRYMNGAEIKCRVRNYCGSDECEPELWKLSKIFEKTILEYYPRKEMIEQTWQLMYAFNHEDTDIYDCIITDENPSIEGNPEHAGIFLNDAFYSTLRKMHQQYGDMKLCYVRYNDVIYSAVPYVEGLGFFSWSSYVHSNRMHSLICHPFDGGKRKVAELIKTEQREPENLFNYIPLLQKAIPLTPVSTERFAAKLFFSNGECKKYVLPISENDNGQEVCLSTKKFSKRSPKSLALIITE
jgi:hypothetical protein